MGEVRNAFEILTGKSEGNKSLGRPRHRWEDNIRIDLNRNRVLSCGLDSSGAE
jgi:hypothetical protein